MPKYIELTKGQKTFVDDEDYDFLNQWKWRANGASDGRFYALRQIRISSPSDGNKRVLVSMHRQILGVQSSSLHIDHINGDTLDNRKFNLRICTPADNLKNRKPHKRGGKYQGPYKGVYLLPRKTSPDKYSASIKSDGKPYFLGIFDSEIDAALAYNNAAIRLHGEFAQLNQIP